jgi:hypothetical protein
MTEAYWQPRIELARKEKIWQRRLAEDEYFEKHSLKPNDCHCYQF